MDVTPPERYGSVNGMSKFSGPANQALERTGRRLAHHGRGLHAARRSTPGRYAA